MKSKNVAFSRRHHKNLDGTSAHNSILTTLLLIMLSLASSSKSIAGNLDRVVIFNIKANTLEKALLQFGIQAHVQIGFASKSMIDGMRTTGLRGSFSNRKALEELLKGSRLEFAEEGNTAEIIPSKSMSPRMHSRSTGRLDKEKIVSEPKPSDQAAVRVKSTGEKSSAKHKATFLEEVTVTGTHIYGTNPAYPVITITRANILKTGLPTIGQVIRNLPQMFSGGENVGSAYVGGINGSSSGTGVQTANIRGIGPGSTLVLVDGHRLAYNGRSSAVDLSQIPTVAVQSIQIETGGSSAIYGSDAVAGVVNVKLRTNFSGEESSAYTQVAEDGGGLRQRYSQSIGRTSSRGSVLLAYEYNSLNRLTAGQREVSSNASAYSQGGPLWLLPKLKSHTLFINTHYDITKRVQSYFEGIYTHIASYNIEPFEALSGVTDEFGSDIGFTYHEGNNRSMGIDGTYAGSSRGLLSFNYPTYKVPFEIDNDQTRYLQVEAHGTWKLFRLPSGALLSAFGIGFSKSSLDIEGNAYAVPGMASRRITNAYLEFNAPLVRPDSQRIGLEHFNLNAAVRYEHYSDFGDTTNPTIGVRYAPMSAITLQGTWGTSFEAPALVDLESGTDAALFPGADFGIPSQNSTVLVNVGDAAHLRPERATTWSATIQYAPRYYGRPRLRLTYYSIRYRDRLAYPLVDILTALENPTAQPFVVHSPSASQQASVIAAAGLFENLTQAPYNPINVAGLVNDLFQNIARQTIHGIDVGANIDVRSAIGDFIASVDGSTETFTQTAVPGALPERIAGTLFNPPKFKMQVNVGWNRNAWHINTILHRVGGEEDTSITPTYKIGPWTTVDGQVGYSSKIPDDGVSYQASLTVSNIFNSSPPLVDQQSTYGIGFDTSNASALGRAFAVSVSVKY